MSEVTAGEWRIDKTAWPPGPWMDEPDRVEFRHLELPCLIVRHPPGYLCGYVGVPPGHVAHGLHFRAAEEALELAVHGGLSFSGQCCHTWWLGFDCAHAGDMVPGFPPEVRVILQRAAAWLPYSYKSLWFVQAETRDLAEQLARA